MRIFIASPDERLRLALYLFLDHEPGIVVVGMSDRLRGLLEQMAASQPEALLLDYELTKQATAGVVSDLHALECHPKVIVLSINPQSKEEALAAGVDGFISKNAPPDELLPIIQWMRTNETNV